VKFKRILVTGCAGFIGSKLVEQLLQFKNFKIVGIDNINNYYDINLKKNRLKFLKNKNFKFIKIDIKNKKKVLENFKQNKYDFIFHLAAQAGVRYSVENPQKYFESNILGHFNILEACREYKPKILFFASSSSVYGDQKKFPLKEEFNTDKPKSFYAATKKCTEIMSYSYSEIYKLRTIGLRFFTVFGPYGRPDMTPYTFLNSYYARKFIKVFGFGEHERDFTYIDDTVNMILALFKKVKSKKSKEKFEIFNVAKGNTSKLKTYISLIEKNLKIKFKKKYIKYQKGDLKKTYGDVTKINRLIKYSSQFDIKEGISKFTSWYTKYHKKK
tara:strand:- start:49906 stop:50889 length:984 start_codon:yes stop_codon:yes gene_type:complete